MPKKLKPLDEHNKIMWLNNFKNKDKSVKNGFSCPNCKSELYDTNPMKIESEWPMNKKVHCDVCTYYGLRYV